MINSVVRGHHVYKSTWTPKIAEVLAVRVEDKNVHDCFAVAVMSTVKESSYGWIMIKFTLLLKL